MIKQKCCCEFVSLALLDYFMLQIEWIPPIPKFHLRERISVVRV